MAKRGGSVFSHVRFGRRVWSPTIPKGEVDILVALEWAEGLRWLPFLKPGTGIFICDTKRIVPPFACLNRHPGAPLRYSKETPADVVAHVAEAYAIDATDMAEQLGNERAANVILLGALSTALQFPTADWERTVAEFVPKKTIAVNLEAFRRGRGWIEEARNTTPPVEAPARSTPSPAEARLPGASRNQSGLVQELRHLREDVPGALPAARCRPHRRAGRAGQMHRLPVVRMAVSGFRHSRPSRYCGRAGARRNERRRHFAHRQERREADLRQPRLRARARSPPAAASSPAIRSRRRRKSPSGCRAACPRSTACSCRWKTRSPRWPP